MSSHNKKAFTRDIKNYTKQDNSLMTNKRQEKSNETLRIHLFWPGEILSGEWAKRLAKAQGYFTLNIARSYWPKYLWQYIL
jgi:hypothetical protein